MLFPVDGIVAGYLGTDSFGSLVAIGCVLNSALCGVNRFCIYCVCKKNLTLT